VGAEKHIGFEVHELPQQDKPINLVGCPIRKVLNLPEGRRIATDVEDIGDFRVFVVDPEDFSVGLGLLRAYLDFHCDAFAVMGEESVRHLAFARGPRAGLPFRCASGTATPLRGFAANLIGLRPMVLVPYKMSSQKGHGVLNEVTFL